MKALTPFQKLTYGLPEGFAQLANSLVGMYGLFFCSDILHMDTAAVGTIFFITRMLGCVTDPAVGMFIDSRRPGPNGKYAPWMLRGSVLTALFLTVFFLAPDLHGTAQLVYVFLTYTLFNFFYTVYAVPYGSLLTTLSQDYSEVNQIGSIRSLIGSVGIAAIGYCVDWSLKGFSRFQGFVNGYTVTALLFGCFLVLMVLLVKRFVREGHIPGTVDGEIDGKGGFRLALRNKPLMIVALVNFISVAAWLLRESATIFFFQYTLDRPDLLALYIAIAGFSQIPIILMLPKLSAKFGCRKVIVAATLLSLVGFAMLWVDPAGTPAVVMFAAALSGTGWSVFYGLAFGMIANTVEYGEWKFGVRMSGVASSSPCWAIRWP